MHLPSHVPTRIAPIHTPELFNQAVEMAACVLEQGDVVGLPTETVYGLAANALDPRAVARIFEVKGRPSNNPLIVHVVGAEMARRCVREWPGIASVLTEAFWPGPLTVVMPKSACIPDVVSASGDTVAIRWPSHPFMQAVIRRCGFPLAAPSANVSGRISPTNAQHVFEQLQGKVQLIVDGGQCQVGIESTVVDATTRPVRVLRPGMIHSTALSAVCGETVDVGKSGEDVVRSPGMMYKHYAPRARLSLIQWHEDGELLSRLQRLGLGMGQIRVMVHSKVPRNLPDACISVIPNDPEAFARALYAEMHQCDQIGVSWIFVEAPPEGPEWEGIRDRLTRAAAGSNNQERNG